jgi:hypothetical protein
MLSRELEQSCLIIVLGCGRSQLSTHGNDDFTMMQQHGQNDKCEDSAVVDLRIYLTR